MMPDFENARLETVQSDHDKAYLEDQLLGLQLDLNYARQSGKIPEYHLKQIHPKLWIAFIPFAYWESCILDATKEDGIHQIQITFPQVASIRIDQHLEEEKIRMYLDITYLSI